MQLEIFGIASNKIFKTIEYTKEQESLNLMIFLHSRSIPIASSCNGEYVCLKCCVNNDVISCQFTIGDFVKKYGNQIRVNYL